MITAAAMPDAEITTSRRRLLALMAQMHFGRIEGLSLIRGEPEFTATTLVISQVKLGADRYGKNRPVDTDLHPAVRDLLRAFDWIGTATIRCLEVQHGLPFRFEMDGVLDW